MYGSEASSSPDKHLAAKKSMLKALISKMRGLMAEGHMAAEKPAEHKLPHELMDDESGTSHAEQIGSKEGSAEEESAESPAEESQEQKSGEDFSPDDVKGFMSKTSHKPKAKHSMAMMSVTLGKASPKGMPFKKK